MNVSLRIYSCQFPNFARRKWLLSSFIWFKNFLLRQDEMKFSLNNLGGITWRQGVFSNFSRIPGVEFETPLLLCYTKGGSIPHLTREVLEYLTQEKVPIQIPLPSTIQCFEGVKTYGNGISKFVGLQDMVTYCSIQDPGVLTPIGYNLKNQISIWSHNGRVPLTSEKFIEIMEAFQPDFYQALSNGDTNSESKIKKIKKVNESSNFLLDQCLEKHQSSSVLNSRGIFGSLEGGYDLEVRKKSAESLSVKSVDGFVINGLHNNGPEVENMDFGKVKPIIEEVLKHLPPDKPRVIHGCWRPEHVLKMVEMGIDVFDASLAYVVTERQSALVFNYSDVDENNIAGWEANSDILYEICLTDIKYKEDFHPILEGCSCLTCRKHTRAYIYHLEDNKELLGRTLLMLHNLHHYMEFFKSIRRAVSQGKRLRIT